MLFQFKLLYVSNWFDEFLILHSGQTQESVIGVNLQD